VKVSVPQVEAAVEGAAETEGAAAVAEEASPKEDAKG
jgi:hypothetical protein